MIQFCSALYLGLRHASQHLPQWSQLTTGMPAALAEPAAARTVAAGLARLTSTEAGTLARSTLHAFWDLMPQLAGHNVAICMDAATYPAAAWAVERMSCRGTFATVFRHQAPDQLWCLASELGRQGHPPLVVTDGVCAGCGRAAPLAEYLDIANTFGGRVVVDDTQALGLVGPEGGGSLRRLGDGAVVLVASLAKAFGAPLAFVGGPSREIASFRAHGEARMHLSPPSLADIHAAARALEINAAEGAARRARLARLVARFCRGLTNLGLTRSGNSVLPIVTLRPTGEASAEEMYQRLLGAGIRTVLHRSCTGQAQVSFLFTALHQTWQVDRAIGALARLRDLFDLPSSQRHCGRRR